MPQLPQYDQPEVKPAPVPGVVARADAPLAAFGGGDQAFNAAQGVAEDASKLFQAKAERGRQMAVDTEVYGAAAQLSSMHTGLMNDAKAQQGRNAFGIYNPTMDTFKKQAAEIGGQLQTPEAKLMYQKLVFEHGVQLDHGLQDHIATQRVEDTKQTIGAASEQFENAALSTALSDPRATQFNLRMAQAADRDLAKNAGLSPVSAQEFMDGRQSARQLQLVNAFLTAGQDVAAEKYFQDHRDEFKGKDLLRAQELTIEGSARGQALRAVDKIFSPSMGTLPADQGAGPAIVQGAQTLGEAQARAREIENPKVRAYASQEVDRRWEQVEKDREQQRRVTLNGLSNVIEKNGGDLNGAIASDPQGWMSLTAAQRTEMQDYSKKMYERVDPKTDFDTWYDLMKLAKNPNTEKQFADVNLRDPYFLNRLSSEKRTQLASMQGEITNKTSGTVGKLSFQNQVTDTVQHEGLFAENVDKLKEEDKSRLAQFSAQLDRDYDNFKAYNLQNTREPNEKERQTLIDFRLGERSELQSAYARTGAQPYGFFGNRHVPTSMVLPSDNVATKRGFFSNDTTRGVNVSPGKNPSISEAAAPPTQIDRVRWSKLIKDAGRPVTEDKMQRIQAAYNAGDVGKAMKVAEE